MDEKRTLGLFALSVLRSALFFFVQFPDSKYSAVRFENDSSTSIFFLLLDSSDLIV